MSKATRMTVALLFLVASSIFNLQSANAALYSFTSHTFNTCGLSGQTGPTTSNCTSAYSGSSWTANTSYFNTSSGIQLWTVPTTATYRVAAYGANGGTGYQNINGGKGAKVQADITLIQGDVIKILVGQMAPTNSSNGGAGGGGGTFVTTNSNTPILIAGGGGGGGGVSSVGSALGVDASITTSGTTGREGTVAGGTSGTGGATPGGTWSGASGGGLSTAGGNGGDGSTGGRAFIDGGAGGSRGGSYGTAGGFGGGGGSTWAAGGGGGYSGGGSDYSDGAGNSREGAGGGGSYLSGANQISLAGANTANGYVTIQILVGAPDAPTIGTATAISPTSATITFSAPANNNGDTITAYTAITTPDSKTATISQSGSGTITISGLSPNTAYVIRVYATNSYGNSPYSSPSGSITTPVATTSITISLPANSLSTTYNSQTIITATIIGTDGKVTFYLNTKRIPNCIGRPTSSLVATCSWKPALHGAANVKAIFTPTSNAYFSSSTTKTFSISRRSGLR